MDYDENIIAMVSTDYGDDEPTTEYLRDEATTPFWREARDEWAQRDNTETQAATPRAKERR